MLGPVIRSFSPAALALPLPVGPTAASPRPLCFQNGGCEDSGGAPLSLLHVDEDRAVSGDSWRPRARLIPLFLFADLLRPLLPGGFCPVCW